MSQPEHQFRVVLRGYDPSDVDRVMAELESRVAVAEAGSQQLTTRLKAAETRPVEAAAPVEPASFAHLGERVAQILGLADEEATSLRDQARSESEAERKAAEQAANDVRVAADQYAELRRRDAETEGSRILSDARRAADEERDSAERDASARRQEAEAIHEQQRANAAQAAADFETTLAERRDRSAAEFQEQQAATQAQLDAMAARLDEVKAQAQRDQEAAEVEARRIVGDAEDRAATLVREARATAERMRTDSERELAAATQRRDSINAQLVNVRQMLATLSGSASGFAVDPLPDAALGDAVIPDLDESAEDVETVENHS